MENNELFFDLARNYPGNDSNEDYIKYYNQGYKNEVIAAIYSKNYYLFNQTSSKFIGVDTATRDSLIVEMIWKCLDDYNSEKSHGKISTMICVYIRNGMRALTQSMTTKKASINNKNCKVFSEFDKEDRIDEISMLEKSFSDIELESYLSALHLKGNQKKYCEVIIDSKKELKMSEVAAELNISRAGALAIKRTLQEKLKDLI